MRQVFMFGERNRIGNDELFDWRTAQALNGRPRKYAMSRATVNIARATVIDHAYSLRERPGGINFVINDQGIPPLDAANNAHRLGHAVIAQTALLDDGKRCIETVREMASFLGKALIGSDNGEVIHPFLFKITSLDDLCGQFINGDIEKALDLPSMHIHCQNSVRACNRDAISDQTCSDGHTGLIFLIGATIESEEHTSE